MLLHQLWSIISEHRSSDNERLYSERVRITGKCMRACLSLWIRPHMESSFVSRSCYLCVERHFSFTFTQQHSRQKQPSFPHIDAYKQQTRSKNAHRYSQRQTHMCAHIHFNSCTQTNKHTHKQLSVVLAISMGNNHALCWKQIENQWWVFTLKQRQKSSEQYNPPKKNQRNDDS